MAAKHIPTTPAHDNFFYKVRDLCAAEMDKLPPDQQVIILAQIIGVISYTLPLAWKQQLSAVVAENIVVGFRSAILQNMEGPKQ